MLSTSSIFSPDHLQIAVTGAASGIGLATAQLLASRGAILSLADVNSTALGTALASLTPVTSQQEHMCQVVDVRDASTVDAWIAATVERFGRLDGAANIAGIITPARPITEVLDDEFERSLAVNVKGVFHCLRAQLRVMTERGAIVSH